MCCPFELELEIESCKIREIKS